MRSVWDGISTGEIMVIWSSELNKSLLGIDSLSFDLHWITLFLLCTHCQSTQRCSHGISIGQTGVLQHILHFIISNLNDFRRTIPLSCCLTMEIGTVLGWYTQIKLKPQNLLSIAGYPLSLAEVCLTTSLNVFQNSSRTASGEISSVTSHSFPDQKHFLISSYNSVKTCVIFESEYS